MLPGLGLDSNGNPQFGAPVVLAHVGVAGNIADGALVAGSKTTDLAVADEGGITVIYGQPVTLTPNTTAAAARKPGRLLPTSKRYPKPSSPAIKTLTTPTRCPRKRSPAPVTRWSIFRRSSSSSAACLACRWLSPDHSGVLGTGARLQLEIPRDDVLTIHIFGLGAGSSNPGFGAFTLDIDVLPQVVSVQAQAALPGGAATSLVLTLQGDRLDPATAENPNNYTVTWLGPNGQIGAGNVVIPVSSGDGGQSVIYNPGANVDVASGLTYPTAVRQTVTLLFSSPLPAGAYEITLSPNITSADLNTGEVNVLATTSSITGGHPLVSARNGVVRTGSSFVAQNLVTQAGTPNPDSIAIGTPFLTQLQNDLSALLDAQLVEKGDDPSITAAVNNEILARFAAEFAATGSGAAGSPLGSIAIIWLDPVSLALQAPQEDRRATYSLGDNKVTDNLARTYVAVGGNVEVIVMANVEGTFKLNVGDVPQTARGGAVVLDANGMQLVSFTNELRTGVTDFALNIAEATTSALSNIGTSEGNGGATANGLADGQNPTAILVATLLVGFPGTGSDSAGLTSAETNAAGAAVSIPGISQSNAPAPSGAGDENPDANGDPNADPKVDPKVDPMGDPKKDPIDDPKKGPKKVKPDATKMQPMPADPADAAPTAFDEVFMDLFNSAAERVSHSLTGFLEDHPAASPDISEGAQPGTTLWLEANGDGAGTPIHSADADDNCTAAPESSSSPSAVSDLWDGAERLLRAQSSTDTLGGDHSGRSADGYWFALFLASGACHAVKRRDDEDEEQSREKLRALPN